MKLHILGISCDNKGKQLEILTTEMLLKQGYTNVSANVISSGGSEFDAIAIQKIPLGTVSVEYQVICECKALDRPINTTDWMKFIGKVYTEKLKNDHTIGLMIALSGANGSVIGSYNDIKKQNLVNLMAGDDIIEFITKEYDLASAQAIESYVKRFTDKSISVINLAYYEQSIYWIIGFIEGGFTILKKDGSLLKDKDLEFILSLLSNNTEYIGYIDIEQENTARSRKINIDKVVLSVLMDATKPLSLDEILSINANVNLKHNKPGNRATRKEIEEAVNFSKFIFKTEEKYALQEFDIDGLIEFFRYIFSEILPVRMLGRKWYLEKINEELLSKILEIQHQIKVPEENRNECLFLIKYSPSALAYAIRPDEDLIRYRSSDGKTIADNVDKGHTEWFMRKLTDFFISDFQNQMLHEVFLDDYKIDALKISQTLSIKMGDDEILTINSNRAMLLAKMDEEFGGQIALVAALPQN